ncbi:MAG: hypothetical protein LRY39_01555, partial [Alphaproteobacteria bacterium]|nr:hypothetical protein [Alphaproteobacteria bacterium]
APKAVEPCEPFRLSEWLDGHGVEKKGRYSDKDLFNDLYDALPDEDKDRFKNLKELMDRDNTFIMTADAIQAVKVGVAATKEGVPRGVIAHAVLSALTEKSIVVETDAKDDTAAYSRKERRAVREEALKLEKEQICLSDKFKHAVENTQPPEMPAMDVPLPPVKPAIPAGM